MTNLRIAAFDLDDTLITTKEQSVKNVRWALGRVGLEAPSAERLLELYGKPGTNGLDAWHTWVLAACPELGEEGVVKFGEFYRSLKDELPETYPAIAGARECIDILLQAGLGIALATGRSAFLVDKRLAEAGMSREWFDVVYTKEDCPVHKPNPKYFVPFLMWASSKGVEPVQCVYVGDHVYDAQAALGAGIKFVGVLTGGTTLDGFASVGVRPENVLESVKYVPERLKNGGL